MRGNRVYLFSPLNESEDQWRKTKNGEKTTTVLKLATSEDTKKCYDIIDTGRKFQQEQGFTQWTKEYPSFRTIQQDIADKKGFVVMVWRAIAGYMCIDFSGEPAYENIEGKWHSSEAYAVVHRMAFAPEFRGSGLSDTVWKLIGEYCLKNGIGYIRVDTDFPNKRMQHILEKNGFAKCGIISFQGSGKIAYDKQLQLVSCDA